MSPQEETNIVPSETGEIAQANVNMDDIFGGAPEVPAGAVLAEVKISKDSATFEVAGETVETVDGYLLFVQSFNVYYKGKFDPSNPVPPDCSSTNGIKPDGGTDPQCENCLSCQMNEHDETLGTRPCQNRTIVYFLQRGSVVPVLLNLAPTNKSKKAGAMGIWSAIGSLVNKVAQDKLKRGVPLSGKEKYQQVEVRLSLQSLTFQNGSACVLQVAGLRVIDDVAEATLVAKKAAEAARDYRGDMEDLVDRGAAAGTDHLRDESGSAPAPDGPDDDLPI